MALAGQETRIDRGAGLALAEAGAERGAEQGVGQFVAIPEAGARQLTEPEGGAVKRGVARARPRQGHL
jgi:hypothetical protein